MHTIRYLSITLELNDMEVKSTSYDTFFIM